MSADDANREPTGDAAHQPTEINRGNLRWRSPQANITGAGILASYSVRFWCLVLVVGVFAGVWGSLLVGLLHLTERLAYGVDRATLLGTVDASPHWRRLAALAVAAVITSVGVVVLGRRSTGGTEVTDAIWKRSGQLDFFRSLARGLLSIVIIGMGVSLGREAAPQLAGASFGSRVSDRAKLPVWQRRLLVAAGAGAGFAAIYNVPLAGTLLAMEVMLGTLALPLVLPALLCSASATAVAWIFLGDGPQYHVTFDRFHPSQLLFAVLLGPIIGLAAMGWTRLIRFANHVRPSNVGRWFAPMGAFLMLGLLSLEYPELLGNGHGIVRLTIVGSLSLGLLLMLLLLKPLVTAACIASGAPGGLLTPTLAVGSLMAAVAGTLWSHVWPGSAAEAYVLIGGAAFLAAAMQGPLTGAVLALELTNQFGTLMVPMLIAVVEATVLARLMGAHSIYSARVKDGKPPVDPPDAYSANPATVGVLDEVPPGQPPSPL